MNNISHMSRAFKSRNYRLFFCGQILSLTGTWMTTVATIWLVYRLTHSALWLGLVCFFSQILTFLFSPFTGVLADRWNKHKILLVTQILGMAESFILAGLVFSGKVTPLLVVILSSAQGFINAFDIPARQAIVVDLLENKDDLGNAIALNSFMFNSARLIGPSIAGLIIALKGEGVCFFIDGISYLGVIFALCAMRFKPKNNFYQPKHIFKELAEGISYMLKNAKIKYMLIFVAFVSLFGMPYLVLLPVFAKEILHGTSGTYGFLLGASGLGAIFGSVYLAFRKNTKGLETVIALNVIVLGTALIFFSFSQIVWLSFILMIFVGFGMLVQMASCNTLLQVMIEDNKRGRVMSFFAMAFMGMMPFGSLMAGEMAHKIGASFTISILGALSIIGAIIFFWRAREFFVVENE
ncbi:major facilitator superfamily membrane protein [Candidatus Omnitrophus magneticus]|uniref:Major facilitator superfamily membrane protein n=1 Tax=Candidatus Omnitrophus magneticus TaxID=1609969 RepID=A0A0F0CTA2_9BACT|nr:major facilitator superfamily membrane protein [Candidatus Omnitrophus magneticus]